MKSDRIKNLINLALSLLLVVTLVSAALPQPAQAATCRTYHTVKSGDTTVSIAKTYGLKWRVIAEANDMEYPYDLDVGDKLCIPPKAEDDDTNIADELKMTVKAVGNTVTITVKGLTAKASFYVRARDGNASVGGWHKLGVMRAKKKVTSSTSFILPRELREKLYLQICLKNGTTDEMACRTVVHR